MQTRDGLEEAKEPKVRGTLIVGAVQAVRRLQSILVIPPDIEPYLSARIEFMKWYPEDHLRQMMAILADLSTSSRHDALLELWRVSEDIHANDIYQQAMTPGSAFLADVLWRAQHDTGEMEMHYKPGAIEFTLVGYEAPSEELCTAIGGYLEMACKKAGIAIGGGEQTQCTRFGDANCAWTFALPQS